MSVELVILNGNIGTNDGLVVTSEGKKICNLSLAVSGRGPDDAPAWHRLVCFDKTAEIAAQYCEKGREIGVSGRISMRTYEKSDGTIGYSTEIIVSELFLGSFQVMTVKGNIGENQGLKKVGQGTSVCSMTLAVDGRNGETCWFTVTSFGKMAENAAKFCDKGREVVVVGRMRNKSYTKDDGTKGFSSELIADTIRYGRRPKAGSESTTTNPVAATRSKPVPQKRSPQQAVESANYDYLDSLSLEELFDM